MPHAESFISAMQALQEIADHVSVPVKGGKRYVMVKDRLEIFRKEFGDQYGIETSVDYSKGFDDGAPIVAVSRIVHDGRVIATGWAVEFVGSTQITDASPVEVAETSAIGRALACFGLAGGEYASFDEMQTHERKQEFRGGKNPEQNYAAPTYQKKGNGGREMDPGLAKQVKRMAEPVQPQFYIPTDHDQIWLQPEIEIDKIVEQIEQIGTTHELGKYWSDLKGFVAELKKEYPDGIAEIKAAMATRHNAVGGK